LHCTQLAIEAEKHRIKAEEQRVAEEYQQEILAAIAMLEHIKSENFLLTARTKGEILSKYPEYNELRKCVEEWQKETGIPQLNLNPDTDIHTPTFSSDTNPASEH
jgi:hypothetical protein